MAGFRASAQQTPSDDKYKNMVGELQEMVEELESENNELTEALTASQHSAEQYKGEYERIQQEGTALFEKYEQKTRK